ncbi:MAG TPA: SagB/ThcOx family dehydrogenase [Thermoplasmatales archaeon]|nr:SagB/ThcOx family dehydrogenase [Thermoplasmatales archaeon]
MKKLWKKGLVASLFLMFISFAFAPATEIIKSSSDENGEIYMISNPYTLPPPLTVDIPLEEAIFRRMSIREFTEEPITDEELSTILWAACGYREDGKRTVSDINNTEAAVIYVLKEDGVYKYDALNHSLVFYKEGDYRDIVGWQYKAPIQLGLCWNTDKADANYGSAELGQIGQNIYLMANALNLGTVITSQTPDPAIEPVGLPPNEEGMGVMPLGHPEHPYNFVYRPMWISPLPRIKVSDISLTTVLEKRNETILWEESELTRQEINQLLWASYGYSYYLDKSQQGKNPIARHRTVPSAHGYYPLRIYAVTKSGIYRYIHGLLSYDLWGLPVTTFLLKIVNGDKRDEVAQASQSFVASAPFIIISVLDIQKTIQWDDLSKEELRWLWYYEAGASAHNILLEATACGLIGNIIPINDKGSICSLIGLDENKFDPLFVIPVGREA